MPVYKCPNGKYRIGSGKCMYKTKADADRAYAGYRAKGREAMKKKKEKPVKPLVWTCECVNCGWTTKLSEKCSTIRCEKCGSPMKGVVVTPGKEAEELIATIRARMESRYLAEPGIDPGTKSAKYYRVRQKAPGLFQRFRQQPFGKPDLGIQVVYGFHRKLKKMLIQSILFLKTKWTVTKIRTWMRAHKFVIMPENWTGLQKLTPVMRKMFNYNLALALEWREFYLEGLKEDKPDVRVWAWYKFEMKYTKSSQGRWIRRT